MVSEVVSKEAFNLLIIDIDAPEMTEEYLRLCETLKKNPRLSDIPITVLTYKKDAQKIAGAIEAGADNFVLKPFETNSFLKRIETICKEIELKKQGKKTLDLNYINYLIELTGESSREDFFFLTPVIFNKLIMDKVKPILGEPVIIMMMKRLQELIGEDYQFMKPAGFQNYRLIMDGVDKVSKGISLKKLTSAFRDYTYAFLQLVKTLTSDILMEHGGSDNEKPEKR